MYLELHEGVRHFVLVKLDFDVAFAIYFHGFCNRVLQLIECALTRETAGVVSENVNCAEILYILLRHKHASCRRVDSLCICRSDFLTKTVLSGGEVLPWGLDSLDSVYTIQLRRGD
jgi:hypothetical protein